MRNRLLISLLLLLSLPLSAQQNDGAEIRLLSSREDAAWVGENVEIYLELWTDALSFSDQAFVLPQVRGGYLMQADSTTVKISERRGGSPWQGIRYSLSLYPQRPGTLEVPSFEVRFSTRQGYNSEPRPHSFRTPPLVVKAQMPPGAESGELLVTTSAFRIDGGWSVQAGESGSVELKTGDAVVLEIRREAEDVPGMVFAPLPHMNFEGLGVYVDTPLVDDHVNRGQLTGTRKDRVTLVCETPGTYRLPELHFPWWDSRREELHRELIPGLTLEVVQNPAWQSSEKQTRASTRPSLGWGWLWLPVIGLLLWWPAWPLTRLAFTWLRRELAATRLEPLNPRGRSSGR